MKRKHIDDDDLKDPLSLVNVQNRDDLTKLCPSNIAGWCPKARQGQCWRWSRKDVSTLYWKKTWDEYYQKRREKIQNESFAYFHFFVEHFLPKILERKEFVHLKDKPIVKFLLDKQIPYIFKANFQKRHLFMEKHPSGSNIMHKWMRDFHKKCICHQFLEEQPDNKKRIKRTENEKLLKMYKQLLTAYLCPELENDWDLDLMWRQASDYPPFKDTESIIDYSEALEHLNKKFSEKYCRIITKIGKRMAEAKTISNIKHVCYSSEEDDLHEDLLGETEVVKQVEKQPFYKECLEEVNKGY